MFTPTNKDPFRELMNRQIDGPSLTARVATGAEETEKDNETDELLPSLPRSLLRDKERNEAQRSIPPYSTSHNCGYSSEDSPHELMRSSMYTIPADEDLFEVLGLPFLVVLQPFNDGVAIPEYRMDTSYECKGCGAFPTPSEETYGFKCAICGIVNELHGDSPSLRESTVEYILADKALKTRAWHCGEHPPSIDGMHLPTIRKWKEPAVIFLIDASSSSKNHPEYKEYLEAMSHSLKSSDFSLLYRRFSVVLIGRSTAVVSNTEIGYSINTMYGTDSESSICAPWFIEIDDLTEERVDALIDMIDIYTSTAPDIKSGVIAAMQLSAYTGGCKVFAWLGSPEYPEGLPDRVVQGAVDCSLSFNVFSHSKSNLEKVSRISYSTNGSVERDNILSIFLDKIKRESVFRCSIRVVTSDGIKKRAIYSGGSSENISSVFFPEMNSNTALSVSFVIEDFLKENSLVYVQGIVDYINLQGEHRVRVFNLKVRATRLVQQIFATLAFDTLFCGFCKFVCSDPVQMIDNIRKVEVAIVTSLGFYKRACAKDASNNQLVLPETGKALPLLVQSLIKYPKMHLGLQARVELSGEVMPLSVERTLRFFYPRLILMSSLFTLSTTESLVGERLCMRNLNSDEIYILDTGSKIIFWFGKGSLDYIEDMMKSEVIIRSLNELKERYGMFMKVIYCIQGEQDADFIGYMVEDQMGGYPKYKEYLGHIHRRVSKE
ncbi:protein transport protein SEC24 [Nematocida sp. LUAm3]|nr:protein transport protein SEC24 [Nematocida sp. LUAm3]KAI5174016.1 protein transport protein SEC24 [Nematocida sp. LUAm2]KAI5177241.1 protein transport protein SEC24 [Nematocida sp. LUAm1]